MCGSGSVGCSSNARSNPSHCLTSITLLYYLFWRSCCTSRARLWTPQTMLLSPSIRLTAHVPYMIGTFKLLLPPPPPPPAKNTTCRYSMSSPHGVTTSLTPIILSKFMSLYLCIVCRLSFFTFISHSSSCLIKMQFFGGLLNLSLRSSSAGFSRFVKNTFLLLKYTLGPPGSQRLN